MLHRSERERMILAQMAQASGCSPFCRQEISGWAEQGLRYFGSTGAPVIGRSVDGLERSTAGRVCVYIWDAPCAVPAVQWQIRAVSRLLVPWLSSCWTRIVTFVPLTGALRAAACCTRQWAEEMGAGRPSGPFKDDRRFLISRSEVVRFRPAGHLPALCPAVCRRSVRPFVPLSRC